MKNKQIQFLNKILTNENVVNSINENLDKIIKLIPEIKNMFGFEHNHPHHHLNVWEHTLLALSLSEQNFDIRLILLLHDIGKPFCFTTDENGIRHFKGHGKMSSEISKKILKKLGFNDEYIKTICKIIEEHDEQITIEEIQNDLNLAKLKFKVQICDALAHNPEKNKYRYAYIEKIEKLIKKEEDKNNFEK